MLSMPQSRSRIEIQLSAGEIFWALPGTLASLEADLTVRTRLYGGALNAALRRAFSLSPKRLIEIRNNTESSRPIMLTPPLPGDIGCIELRNESIYLNPGVLLAFSGDIRLGARWAGVASALAGEGLLRLNARGTGRIWYCAFGALLQKNLSGEVRVDPSHLLAYESGIRYQMPCAKTVVKAIARGETITPVLGGSGRLFLQSRSLSSLTYWLNHTS